MLPEEIAGGLDATEEEARRLAVIAIGEHADPVLRPELLRGLGDSSWRVREEATRVAVEVAEPFALLPALVDALCQGDNVGLRNAAISVLGGLGGVAADGLVAALREGAPGSHKFIIEALGDVGGPTATAALIEQLDSGDANNVAASIEALANSGGPGAEDALRALLSSADPFIRTAALDALNRLGVALDWEVLSPLLQDSFLRGVLVEALGKGADPRAIPFLVSTLQRTPSRPSSAACEALRALCETHASCIAAVREALGELDPGFVQGLAGLSESDGEGRFGALLILCIARRPEGVRGLLLAADSARPLGDEVVAALHEWGAALIDQLFEHAARRDATAAATSLSLAADLAEACWPNQDDQHAARARVRAELRAALASPDTDLRVVAARALASWGEATDAPALVDAAAVGGEVLVAACRRALFAISESAPDAVRSALHGVALDTEVGVAFTDLIVELEGQAALPRLRDVLLGGSPDARCAAVVGLSVLGGTQAAELIALSLTDESPDVQLYAAEGLGRVVDEDGEPLGVAALLLALDGSPAELQAAVARALGLTGSARAVDPLRKVLARANPRVRVAALEAMSDLHAEDLDDLLIDALAHEDSELVKHALSRISLDDPRMLEVAQGLLEHPRWDVRQLCVRLLGDRPEPAIREALQARAELELDDLVLRALDRALGRSDEGE